jgi:hypothetical protein
LFIIIKLKSKKKANITQVPTGGEGGMTNNTITSTKLQKYRHQITYLLQESMDKLPALEEKLKAEKNMDFNFFF